MRWAVMSESNETDDLTDLTGCPECNADLSLLDHSGLQFGDGTFATENVHCLDCRATVRQTWKLVEREVVDDE
jgi:hypothetical protein